ncbi:MAG: T9SS type A sorting domain-containing protein, partial [Salibacteraceae bacterium]
RTANGTIFIAGDNTTTSYPIPTNVDMVLARVDNQGMVTNSSRYGGSDAERINVRVTQLSSGSIVLGASKFLVADPLALRSSEITRLDAQGQSCCASPHTVSLDEVGIAAIPDVPNTPGTLTVSPINTLRSNAFAGGVDVCSQPRLAVATSEDVLEPAALRFYPNPTQQQLHLQIDNWDNNSMVTLIDPMGKTVLRAPLTGPRQTLDLSGIAAGYYTLQLTHKEGGHTYKLIIQ